jgi:hypothetical protein
LRSVRRLAKGAGSFGSFLGINATGASGLATAFAAAVVGGGDTGRVIDCGSVWVSLAPEFDSVAVVVVLLVSLFTTGVLPLGIIEPTKTGFGTTLAGATAVTASLVPSLSFNRLGSGSLSNGATLLVGDNRWTGVVVAS